LTLLDPSPLSLSSPLSISLLEVVSAYFIDEHGWSRKQASWILGGIIFLLGIPSAFWERFFGLMDGLATNYLLPIGAFLIALFAGWVLSYKERREEFHRGELRTLPLTLDGHWSSAISVR